MRKVDDGKKEKKRKKKNVVPSRPPERRSTGMPHARAKILQPVGRGTVLTFKQGMRKCENGIKGCNYENIKGNRTSYHLIFHPIPFC